MPSQEIITRDNAMVTVDGVVFYQVLDPVKASYEVRRLEILNLTMTTIRTVMGISTNFCRNATRWTCCEWLSRPQLREASRLPASRTFRRRLNSSTPWRGK